jgi:hypothetical protein
MEDTTKALKMALKEAPAYWRRSDDTLSCDLVFDHGMFSLDKRTAVINRKGPVTLIVGGENVPLTIANRASLEEARHKIESYLNGVELFKMFG